MKTDVEQCNDGVAVRRSSRDPEDCYEILMLGLDPFAVGNLALIDPD